jgi:RNA polymerase sigma factor (sigma-70 family)
MILLEAVRHFRLKTPLPAVHDEAYLFGVSAPQPADVSAVPAVGEAEVEELLPIISRVVRARVSDPQTAEDLIQETVARVLASFERIEPGMLQPYAIVTARNLVASMRRVEDRHRRHQHRVVELGPVESPDEPVLAAEERRALAVALARLAPRERELLLAHEVSGEATQSLAAETGSTAGAVAAQLNRSRGRLRVEYLLALDQSEPPTQACRAVLLAVSTSDRRRQRELGADRHLLECDLCARLSHPLLERGRQRDERQRISIRTDGDIVAARQAARTVAASVGFSATDLTVVATAVSEVARNIVRFADAGEIVIEVLSEPRAGVRIVALDTGPGIPNVEQALADGYSTYSGLGLGLPGARRLMDEFAIVSEPGRGTTVTMTKWREEAGP